MANQTPASPTATAWNAQLQSLNELLANDPRSPQAWRWRTQIRILSYLLSRYGSFPGLTASLALSPMRLFPSNFKLPTRIGKPLRSPSVIRATLERITAANQPRKFSNRITNWYDMW